MTLAIDDDETLLAEIRRGRLDPDLEAAMAEATDVVDGRYALERKIGSGMTSVVYAAYDMELERDVAVKMIHPQYSNTLFEASSAGRISHENVASILEVSHEGGYIVMELLSEERDRKDDSPDVYEDSREIAVAASKTVPRDLAEALRWVRDAARGIAAAHRANVWHGDLKPHNALVMPFSRRIKLIDFGMASSVGRTRWAGTPEYIAPEVGRLIMERRRGVESLYEGLDRAAIDMYGLGCFAYDLITGRRPRPTKSSLHQSAPIADLQQLRTVENARLEEALQTAPKFTRDLETRWDKRALPRRVTQLLAHTLDETPLCRGNPTALADAIDDYLANRPMSHERNLRYWWLRTALWCRRRPTLALGIIGGLVLIAMVVMAWAIEAKRDSLAGERDILMAEVAKQKEEVAKQRDMVGKQKRELEEADSALESVSRDWNEVGTSLLADLEKQRREHESLHGAYAKVKDIHRRLAEAVELGRDQIAGMTWAIVARDATIAELEGRMRRDQVAYNGDIERLRANLVTAQRDLATSIAEGNRLSAESNRLSAENRTLQAENLRLSGEVREKSLEITELRATLPSAVQPGPDRGMDARLPDASVDGRP